MPYHRCRRWPGYWCMYAIVHEENQYCVPPELFHALEALGWRVLLKNPKLWQLENEFKDPEDEDVKRLEELAKKHGLKLEEQKCQKIEDKK